MPLKCGTVFEIYGKNFPLLLSKLNVKKIPFEDLYYNKKGNLQLTVDKTHLAQFKSILGQSWKYKIIGKKGLGTKVQSLFKRVGIIIGVLIFIVGTFIGNNLVLGVRLEGDYKYFTYEINELLAENGIKKFSRFSQISYTELGERLYAKNPLICYSLVKKQGNWLVIQVKKSQTYYTEINKSQTQIVASVSGEITYLKVLRGVPLKKVGDAVREGEIIVTGERVEDKTYSNFVLASVGIKQTFDYQEDGKDTQQNKSRAVARAKLLCGAKDYSFVKVTCENNKILVQLEYIEVIGGQI